MSLNLGVFVGMNPQLSIARVINLIFRRVPKSLGDQRIGSTVQGRLTQNFGLYATRG